MSAGGCEGGSLGGLSYSGQCRHEHEGRRCGEVTNLQVGGEWRCRAHLGPHRYVAWEGSRWRTCAVCGAGAGAHVHRVG